ERTTDFIFCVLAEEWGFLGSLIILTLYAIFLIVMLRSALKIKELYSSLVVVGIVSMLFFHVIVNLGMVVGFLPIVGIPLPFFSYGGSSLLTSLFCLGIVLGLTMRRTVFS
ncbi:MAG: FtsW/RodA/SpoVE family cell cycle protein, partial [Bdellovibrionales bacterium]|nr:FtsW/RodA/SpoVE family cell cycle protein [Bdellovibrionales bacterium]